MILIHDSDLREIDWHGKSKRTPLIDQTLIVGGTPCSCYNNELKLQICLMNSKSLGWRKVVCSSTDYSDHCIK